MADLRERLLDRITYATAIFFSGNRQPHMSGDPRARLGAHQKRACEDAAAAALDAIIAAFPSLSAPAPASGGEAIGCTCQRCHRLFKGDLLVPDEVWAKISPVSVDGFKGGGLLCAACIVDAICEAGIWPVVFGCDGDARAEAEARAEAAEKEAEALAAITCDKPYAHENGGMGCEWRDRATEAERQLAEARAAREWRMDMENAPTDRVIEVVARYPHATAGFPTYAMWNAAKDGWYHYSRHAPEPVIAWAWRERTDWPMEPARAAMQTGGAVA